MVKKRKKEELHHTVQLFAGEKQLDVFENIGCDKEGRNNIHKNGNLFSFTANQFNNNIGDEAECNTIGDAVAERHDSDGKEGGECILNVVPCNLGNTLHHQHTDDNESGSGSGTGNQAGDRSKNESEDEENTNGSGGKTGAAALGDTSRGFNISGNSGGTEAGACAGGNSVSDKSLGAFRKLSVFVQHAGSACSTNQGTNGIEAVNNGKADDSGDQRKNTLAEDAAEIKGKEGTGKGDVREVESNFGNSNITGGDTNSIVDDGCNNDAEEDSTLDFPCHQAGDNKDTNDNDDTVVVESAVNGELKAGKVVGLIQFHDTGTAVKAADDGDKETDTCADSSLQRSRDGIDDLIAQRRNSDDEEEETGDQNDGESLLICIAHTEANSKGEESVQAHTGSLCKGNISKKCGEQAANGGRDTGCSEDRSPIHSRLFQIHGIDKENVRHGKERGETGNDLSFDSGVVLFELEKLFHTVRHPFKKLHGHRELLKRTISVYLFYHS